MSSSDSTQLHSREASFSLDSLILEPLESRIAPATIWNAGSGGDVNYTTQGTPFVLAADSDQASIAGLFTGSDDHYYLELGTKDVLNIVRAGAESTTLITVNSGKAIAFFYDANDNGVVELDEFSGLSISGGADVSVGDSIHGDVLVNLDSKTGAFSADTLSVTGGIKNLTVSGSVEGNIYSGGAISKLTVSQSVEIVGTGTAASNEAYHFGGAGNIFGNGILGDQTPAAKKAGANISNISVGDVASIFASDGGAGGAGGTITNVTLTHDTDGFEILAGSGGDGSAGATKGGAGGKVSNVTIVGVSGDITTEAITIGGGAGGLGSGTGVGGAGGGVDKVYVGYERQGGSLVKSPGLLSDTVFVTGGMGGDGKTGGAGGALNDINVRVQPSDFDPANNEIRLHGGIGGDTTDAKGKSGNGGSVSNYFILSNFDGAINPLTGVEVHGGDAGSALNGSKSGNGGAVTTGVILAKAIEIRGGDGAVGGTLGGNGGSISNLEIAYPGDAKLTQFGQAETNVGDIFAQAVTLAAGSGGNSSNSGKGGSGGSISNVSAPDTDLSQFAVAAGNGGTSTIGTKGTGGNGGSISNLHFESDRDTNNQVPAATIQAGDGGDGAKKGGVGGSLSNSAFLLTDANIVATTGDGGSSSSGTGSNAGSATFLTLVSDGTVGVNAGTVSLTTGDGGAAGGKAKAGNGGGITSIAAVAWGNVTVQSGDGGAATTGTSGNGGSVINSTIIANDPRYSYSTTFQRDYNPDTGEYTDYEFESGPTNPTVGSASLIAGDAGENIPGSTPKKGGNGGSITGTNVTGLLDVTMTAGAGSFGGSGGDVKSSGALGAQYQIATIYQTEDTTTQQVTVDEVIAITEPGAFGNVFVAAGDGSNGPKNGGKGGSLIGVISYTSNGTGTAIFEAGDGGGEGSGTGGAGGSISTLTILGGQEEFSVVAGNGGNSVGKGAGGVGGGVSGVSVASNDAGILLHKVAAGDGGDSATGKGGTGGSVTNVFTFDDIGVRYGEVFGFNTMGGIFAGAGGEGATSNGAAGNVINVTASAIASIVAGRDLSPQLVSKIDGLYRVGDVDLVSKTDGSFDLTSEIDPIKHQTPNLNLANYVGGISGVITAPNADQFKTSAGAFTAPVTPWVEGTVPFDGLIAAIVLGKTNVAANAWLQPNADGTGLQLVSAFNS